MARRKKRKKPPERQHSYVVPDEVYYPADAAARMNGDTVSDIIRRTEKRYASTWGSENNYGAGFLRQLFLDGGRAALDKLVEQWLQEQDES